jgi:hypothetical protein
MWGVGGGRVAVTIGFQQLSPFLDQRRWDPHKHGMGRPGVTILRPGPGTRTGHVGSLCGVVSS